MKVRVKKHNHMTSLRLPDSWHRWVTRFANSNQVPLAQIYRAAIRQFIERNQ